MIELTGHNTRVVLSSQGSGIQRIILGRHTEIPFLIPPLTGEHFFTGQWPPLGGAVAYEPQVGVSTLEATSEATARWHQPATPWTQVETTIAYEIVGPGSVAARFTTTSHASSYPHGYVGLFWASMPRQGGQRGMHLSIQGPDGEPRWRYFQGGGDSWCPRANTVLGPEMPHAERDSGHPSTYFLAESPLRFAWPIQVGRWRGLYYSLEVDTSEVAFTAVPLGTAVGGPSWDIYWRLRPGQSRSVLCRVTIGPWAGWRAVERRYRSWPGRVASPVDAPLTETTKALTFAPPDAGEPVADSALALSQKLYETKGRKVLERLNLLDRCSVGCFGGMSQNAGLDDKRSRDHMWGPYLTFLLRGDDWRDYAPLVKQAIGEMSDEVGGVRWRGYDGPHPRQTGVWEIGQFLRSLTGLASRPEADREWLPHITNVSLLGRRCTERLFDAAQGRVFHDPGGQFTELWRHWTGYVPPDIHRALVARSLFRVWNAGPEYNLARAHMRDDAMGFVLCLAQFINEVIELAFCWNEQFVPHLKWRAAHFRRLPLCPTSIRDGVATLCQPHRRDRQLTLAASVATTVKELMSDLYHTGCRPSDPLCKFAHAIRDEIEDPEVKRWARLDW